MFGVGTDYCLLLVSRYREELHRIEDKHEAMQRALRRAGPALLASGCTVIAAMLVLLLAEGGSTKSLGPVSAIGVGRRAARRADAAAGAADHRRAAGLLAAQRHRGVQAAGGDSRATAGCGGASATSCCSGRGSRWARPTAFFAFCSLGPAGLPGGLQHRRLLQEGRRERRGLRGARALVPGRRAGPDRDHRPPRGRRRATDADVAAARERVRGHRRRRARQPAADPLGGRRSSRGSTSPSATTPTPRPRWPA